ncbi:MAG: 50S ribosomal protein L29 [Patescibacteria group bacterium]
MKIAELRKLSPQELTQALLEKRASLRAIRFNVSSAKGKNIMARKGMRRDIARIMTLSREAK